MRDRRQRTLAALGLMTLCGLAGFTRRRTGFRQIPPLTRKLSFPVKVRSKVLNFGTRKKGTALLYLVWAFTNSPYYLEELLRPLSPLAVDELRQTG